MTVPTVVTYREFRNGRASLVTSNTYWKPSRLNSRHQRWTPLRDASSAVVVDTTMTFHIGRNMMTPTSSRNTYMTAFCG